MATAADIITRVGYRTRKTIDSNSDPSQAEVLAWIEEACNWIQGVCIEYGSELGRTIGNIILLDGIQEYDDLASSLWVPAEKGWIKESNTYYYVTRVNKDDLVRLHGNPTDESRPEYFYVTNDNKIGFIDIPDQTYDFYLPYWPRHSITKTNDPIPFNDIFNEVIIEAVSIRVLNRDEYNVQFEQGWLNWLSDLVVRTIEKRQRYFERVARRDF